MVWDFTRKSWCVEHNITFYGLFFAGVTLARVWNILNMNTLHVHHS